MMHGVYEGMFVVGRGWEGWRLRGTEWFTWWDGGEREGGRAG